MLTTGALDPSRSRWFGACLRRPAPRDLPSSRTDIAWRTIIRIIHDVGVEPLFVPQDFPARDETTHIDVGEQRGQGRPLRAAPALVLVPSRPTRPTPLVGLLHRCHQPHLDQ